MPNKVASIVLSRPSPCDVLQGYPSVDGLPAALLDDPVGHLVESLWVFSGRAVAVRSSARFGARGWAREGVDRLSIRSFMAYNGVYGTDC